MQKITDQQLALLIKAGVALQKLRQEQKEGFDPRFEDTWPHVTKEELLTLAEATLSILVAGLQRRFCGHT